MKLSGFTFVRNAVTLDYPFLESLRSILPLCDEFVIAVGDSEDSTLDRIRGLDDPKIRIIETRWDDSKRTGGTVLADQTNIALRHITGDWGFYLQADEVVHENDLPKIKQALESCHSDPRIEGLLFSYHHFYGSYSYVGASRRWYRREIRLVRNLAGLQSWGDAQGFRINGRKLRVKLVDASIYHYGWVRSPFKQQEKQKRFNRYWHDDQWVREHVGDGAEYDYSRGGRLKLFEGGHPALMTDRIRNQDWHFAYDPAKTRQTIKETVLDWLEDATGIRIGEYRNYDLI